MGQTKLMNRTLGRAGGVGTEIPVLERSFFAWLQEPAVEDVVASWSVRSSPDRAVWVREHCVVFLGNTLNSHSASLFPGV